MGAELHRECKAGDRVPCFSDDFDPRMRFERSDEPLAHKRKVVYDQNPDAQSFEPYSGYPDWVTVCRRPGHPQEPRWVPPLK